MSVYNTRAPDAGAWGPPVLRGECEEVFVFELRGIIRTNCILLILHTKWPRRKALRPPLRVRGGYFVFRLSGTHELHTKWLRREASRPRVRGYVLCFDRAVRTNCIRSGHEARLGVLG